MEYCFKNVGKEPVSALGIVVAPKKNSRPLTQPELQLAWNSELPEGIKIVPFLLESELPTKAPVIEANETEPITEELPASKRRGRPKQEV